MAIRWLEDAVADVREIYRHIAADNPTAAASTVRRIQQSAEALAGLGDRGRPGRWPGTRELIVAGTPYIVPYLHRDGGIEIPRVFHGARRWPPSHDKGGSQIQGDGT